MPHRDSTKGYSRHQFPSGACGSTRTLRPCYSSGCKPCGDLRTNLLKAPVALFVCRLRLRRRLPMALSADMAVRKLRRSRDAITWAAGSKARTVPASSALCRLCWLRRPSPQLIMCRVRYPGCSEWRR